MNRLQRIIRRAITLFWTAITLVVVTLAVMVGLGKLLLPYSDRFQPQLEQRLSEVIRAPVRIEQFSGDWKALGPRLELRKLQIFPEDGGDTPLLVIDHAAVDIRPLAMLLPQKAAYQFTIIGADLKFVRDIDGNIQVSGVGLQSSSTGTFNLDSLASLGEIRLEELNVTYSDAALDMQAGLEDVNARLQFRKNSSAVEFQARVPGPEQSAAIVNGSAELVVEDGRVHSVKAWLDTEVTDFDQVAQMFPAYWSVQGSGSGEMEYWVNWDAVNGVDVLGRVDNENLQLQLHPQGEAVYAEKLGGYFRFKRQAKKEWQLQVTDLDVSALGRQWQSDLIQVERSLAPDRQMWVLADGGDINFTRPIVQGLMRRWRPADDKWVLAQMDGQIEYLELLLGDGWQPRIIKAAGNNLTLRKWKNWPVINGMEANIDFLNGEGRLDITGEATTITWPRVFKEPILAGDISCQLDLERFRKGEWKAWSQQCRVENDALALNTRLYLEGNSARPYMQADATVERAEIGRLGPYWADAIMSETAVQWLRRGLLGGRVENGTFSIDGDLDDWPFRNNEGVFNADFKVAGGRLDYSPGWPLGEQIAAQVTIRNSLLEVTDAAGRVGDVPLDKTSARVHMRRPVVVELDFNGAADAGALMEFTRASPLDEIMQTDLSPMQLLGPATVSGHLKVDKTDPLGRVRVNGAIGLADVRLQDDRWDLLLENIRGQLNFSETGIGGDDLTASFKGFPARGEMQAGQGYAGDNSFRAVLTGKFPVAAIVASRFESLDLVTGRSTGEAQWRIETYSPRTDGDQPAGAWLVVDSDLVGIQTHLPAPLNKNADEKLPLHLRLPLTGEDSRLQIDLDGLVSIRTLYNRGTYELSGANVLFGSAEAADAEAGSLRMSGEIDSLNLDGWMDLLGDSWQSAQAQKQPLQIDDLALQVEKLSMIDRGFDNVNLAARQENGRWKVVFDSRALAGTLHLPNAQQNALAADFEVLHLPLPESKGMQLSTDPRNVPILHLFARDLRYGKLRLGETRLEAWPKDDGLHFESVESTSADVAIRASGDWFVAEGKQQSKFIINITSESLGGLIESISADSSMRAGQTVVAIDATWPGAPSAFSMEHVNGKLELHLIDGRIPDAEPGAGRILGLLSLQALPRRLALDFRDVFASGLNFDEANGSFNFVDGIAHTDDLELSSPAAVIKISGATNFSSKEYDQVIIIEPGVGSTLPLIGAITGGPGGAAAGLALQGLFKKPLGRVTQVQYSLKGPWSEPLIEPISAQQAPEPLPEDGDGETTEPEPVANVDAVPGEIR